MLLLFSMIPLFCSVIFLLFYSSNKPLEEIQSISNSMESLTQSKAKIVDSISDLSAITEENAASCQETSSSLNEISEAMDCIGKNAEKTKEMAAELGSTIRYFHE